MLKWFDTGVLYDSLMARWCSVKRLSNVLYVSPTYNFLHNVQDKTYTMLDDRQLKDVLTKKCPLGPVTEVELVM